MTECIVCFEAYDESIHLPKTTSCNHICCLHCLTTLWDNNQKNYFPCPECSTRNIINPYELCTNFNILNKYSMNNYELLNPGCDICHPDRETATCFCENCRFLLCDTHATEHIALHPLIQIHGGATISTCPKHKIKIEFYCKECNISICPSCCVIYHHTHNVISVEDAFQEMKSGIAIHTDKLDSATSLLKRSQEHFEQLVSVLYVKEAENIRNINEIFNLVMISLKERECALMAKLSTKRQLIETHKEYIESFHLYIDNRVRNIKHQIELNNAVQCLELNESLISTLNSLNDLAAAWQRQEYNDNLNFACDMDGMKQFIDQWGSV